MLHEALKQIRKFHQLKQSELANKFRISKSYFSELESGVKPISLELLKKYSEVFSIPVSSLLMFSENLELATKSDKFRLRFAKKILKMLEWMNENHKHNKET